MLVEGTLLDNRVGDCSWLDLGEFSRCDGGIAVQINKTRLLVYDLKSIYYTSIKVKINHGIWHSFFAALSAKIYNTCLIYV